MKKEQNNLLEALFGSVNPVQLQADFVSVDQIEVAEAAGNCQGAMCQSGGGCSVF